MKRILCLLLLMMLALSAAAETVQDQALSFFQSAGIEADSVMRAGDEIIITLPGGGTAALHCPGDYDAYNLAWRFSDAADEEIAAYLNHALTLLASLEARIPADLTGLAERDVRKAQSYAAMVANSLRCLEQVGRQGLDILLKQLAAHEDSALNSLRAQLASRLLGEMDNTGVDPAQGLAWYDALPLSVQEEHP